MSRSRSPQATGFKFGGGRLAALDELEVPVAQLLEALNDPSAASNLIKSKGISRETLARSLETFRATLLQAHDAWW